MTECVLYAPQHKAAWNHFVSNSKNGVFLFNRDYMEYHIDRFTDHSLMFFHNNHLVALLPANIQNGALQSHGGLTFGGVISDCSMKTSLMLGIFRVLVEHCRSLGLTEIAYKPVPHIYHSVPSDEDLYALFNHNSTLTTRNVSSCIYLPGAVKFDSNRLDNIRKANKNNLTVKESTDFESFMAIEEAALAERHRVKPVHSTAEIRLLAARFPDSIKLFASFKDERMLAGIIIYESSNVAHMQYAANSPEGWDIGAQDIIEDYLINQRYRGKRYFDFGISTEEHGRVLNLGLIARKENFGASAVTYDAYRIPL